MMWTIDAQHGHIRFTARKLGFIVVKGEFTRFTGSITLDEGDVSRSIVDVRIDAASVQTGNRQRDSHLKSADFLDVRQYPCVLFHSKRIAQDGDTHIQITGDLTIRDVTQEIVLEVERVAQLDMLLADDEHPGFSAYTILKLKEWDVNRAGLMGKIVGDELRITIELQPVRQRERVA